MARTTAGLPRLRPCLLRVRDWFEQPYLILEVDARLSANMKAAMAVVVAVLAAVLDVVERQAAARSRAISTLQRWSRRLARERQEEDTAAAAAAARISAVYTLQRWSRRLARDRQEEALALAAAAAAARISAAATTREAQRRRVWWWWAGMGVLFVFTLLVATGAFLTPQTSGECVEADEAFVPGNTWQPRFLVDENGVAHAGLDEIEVS